MKGGEGRRRLRLLLFLPFSLFPLASQAQVPDVRARLDLAMTVDYREGNERIARLYSPLGRPSTVGLTLILETGYNVVVAERLQRLPKDAESDIFDEGYIEDPGIWRVGKQYLPFGAGRLLHESAIAARIDSNLIAENLPVALALVGEGQGRQKGAVLHVGRSTLGASFALGDHFGISGTSLGVVRRPDDAPGRGGGWGQAFGIDSTRRLGKLSLSADFASFNGGSERALSVLDLEATFFSDAYRTIGVGYTSSAGGQDATFVRVFGRLHAARNLDLEPFVRFKDQSLYDVAVAFRLRL